MNKLFLVITSFTILLLSFAITTAQDADTCPALVQQAMDTIDDLCSDTGRNQACYGNLSLIAEPQPGSESFEFDSPGDRVDVSSIRTLQLSSMDAVAGEWGVSLMRLQANLPDTLPGQNVTFLLFGEVHIEAANPSVELAGTVSAAGAINVRGGASTSDDIVTTLANDSQVTVTGRNQAADWVRVELSDDEESVGWVAVSLLQIDGDIDSLPVVQPGDPTYGPLQAFYLQTGIGDAPCTEAPHSGLLIQTPEGGREIEISVNNVSIRLASTAYLQAQAGDSLVVTMIEGQATVSTEQGAEIVPDGARLTVPIDENLHATGAPNDPEPYTEADVQALPVEALPREIEVAEPRTQTSIDRFVQANNRCYALVGASPVNVRSGPGTAYPVTGTLPAGDRSIIATQAVGTDGLIWWELSAIRWVRSDVVDEEGRCEDVRVATNIPDPPVSQPAGTGSTGGVGGQSGGSGNLVYINMNGANNCSPDRVPLGTTIDIVFGNNSWTSPGDRDNAMATLNSGISVNGQGLSVTHDHYTVDIYFGFNTRARYTPPSTGVYTFVGYQDNYPPPPSCVVTVE